MERSNQQANSLAGLKPIRTRRAFEDVVLQLKQAVVEGRLAVGDRLPHERELARQFGVSRQSVREGLRMLEGFGILSARRGAGPDSGWTVSGDGASGLSAMLDLYSTLQGIPISDLLEIRETLEMQSARSASARASAAQRANLVAAARSMGAFTDAEQFLAADAEFHVAIARASGNALAQLLMEAIRESMQRAMLLGFTTITDWDHEREVLIAEHAGIASKIRDGHGDAAAAAVSEHICGFYARVLDETGGRRRQPVMRPLNEVAASMAEIT
jgi:GntR family transcriptional repressor for pyruvate dehydrogenase complex